LAGGLAGYELDEFVKFDEQDGGEAVLEDEFVRVARKCWHLALLKKNESQNQCKLIGGVVKSST
jgi:hypothetical protein